MDSFPRLTIVTPSYNQAAFLEQTMRSVLDQEYPNLEYMVVDGGSTDGSQEIIRRYAGQLSWWVSEPDRGQAEAINKGLARASGEYVAWLNSDDLYLPGALHAAVQALASAPQASLVYSNVQAIDEHGMVTNLLRYNDWQLPDLMAFSIIGQPSVFMRRSVLMQVGGLDLDYHYLLDHHLWLRLAALAPVKYVDEVWAVARYHPAAKNVAQAVGFGQEAYRLVAWMQETPPFNRIFFQYKRRILAGAHRINGRYLLDGGQAWGALKAYAGSWFQSPRVAMPEAHRMLFAFLSLFGLKGLKPLYLRLRTPNTRANHSQSKDH